VVLLPIVQEVSVLPEVQPADVPALLKQVKVIPEIQEVQTIPFLHNMKVLI
jgi:hypothetical protein